MSLHVTFSKHTGSTWREKTWWGKRHGAAFITRTARWRTVEAIQDDATSPHDPRIDICTATWLNRLDEFWTIIAVIKSQCNDYLHAFAQLCCLSAMFLTITTHVINILQTCTHASFKEWSTNIMLIAFYCTRLNNCQGRKIHRGHRDSMEVYVGMSISFAQVRRNNSN